MSPDDGAPPTVLLLDGDYDNTLQIAKELSRDLDSRVVGVGTSRYSRLFFSRYCDASVVLPEPGTAAFPSALLSLVERLRPDVVVPVGTRSTTALDRTRDRIPDVVTLALPPSDSLGVALDKRRTLSLAIRQGIAVPPDHTADVEAAIAAGRESANLDQLPFPLFLKARYETGETTTAKVQSPATFWDAYDELCDRVGHDDLIVQQCVDETGPTYGCGLLFTDDGLELAFTHVETRSVPRRGGSGTRLAALDDDCLESRSAELLDALDWRGVALVEYRRVDDEYVLMEINPTFWASYALASQCGHRFASTLVASLLDLPRPDQSSRTGGERVFPLRELSYCLTEPDESLVAGATAMGWPLTRPAFNLDDPFAWLVPPASVVRDVSPV